MSQWSRKSYLNLKYIYISMQNWIIYWKLEVLFTWCKVKTFKERIDKNKSPFENLPQKFYVLSNFQRAFTVSFNKVPIKINFSVFTRNQRHKRNKRLVRQFACLVDPESRNTCHPCSKTLSIHELYIKVFFFPKANE